MDSALGSFLKAGVAERRGYSQTSANFMRAALSRLNWDNKRPVLTQPDGWRIFLDESVEDWCVFQDSTNRRVVINEWTYDTLGFEGPAMTRFAQDFLQDGSAGGMKFIVRDAGPYAAALRKRAEVEGTDMVQQKDALTLLAETANALVIQAASLNRAPTELQMQTFYVRYARLRAEFEAAEERLEQVRSLVDLAESAITDVA